MDTRVPFPTERPAIGQFGREHREARRAVFGRYLMFSWISSLLLASVVNATTLDVCPSACTYTSIQAAVDVAASGDTIDIGPGTYVEVVQVDVADLEFVGAGADVTIVDGPLSTFVFEAGAGSATLSGVTLHSRVLGSCIQNYADLTVRDSVLEECYHESNGGGIYTSGDLVLERVSVLSSTASPEVLGHGRGGGLYVDGDPTAGGPTVRIYDSVFANNEALFGGGLYVGTGAVAFIDGTVFTGNNAGDPSGQSLYTGRGGAIRTFGELHVTNSTFFYNSADLFGGAIAVNCSDAPVRIATSVMFENYTGADSFNAGALPSGGGLYVESGSEVRVIATEFYGNIAGYGGGIGVYNLLQQGTVTLVQNALISNHAQGDGGGLWVYGGDVTANSTTLALNLAEGSGGGAYGSAGVGTTTFRNSTIVDNIAFGTGGGVHPSSMVMRNTVLAGNSAAGGSVGASSDDCDSGWLDSEGHNLFGTVDGCGSLALGLRASDLNGTDASPLDPLLGPLSDVDGGIEAGTYTPALLPLVGSPVVDTGRRCKAVDQNGNRRPVDGGSGTRRCDRGAMELDAGCGQPVATTALEPVDGAFAVGLQPLFVWEPKAGAATYDVTVATQPPPFGASVVAEISGISATHWAPEAALSTGQIYYWQVRSHSLCGARIPSDAFSFTTM